jgi:aminoglycoside phosphotransferase (APT) family kinase protein
MRDAVTRLARLHPSMPWEWIERILERLPDGEALCHGDFHPGQVTLSEGRAAVLDWNGAKRGDALFDYARTRVLLSFGEPPPGTSPPLRFLGKVAVAFWFLRMRGRTNATR